MMRYYTLAEAKRMHPKEAKALALPDGHRDAVRIRKGGKHDGDVVAPWALMDFFSIPAGNKPIKTYPLRTRPRQTTEYKIWWGDIHGDNIDIDHLPKRKEAKEWFEEMKAEVDDPENEIFCIMVEKQTFRDGDLWEEETIWDYDKSNLSLLD